MGCDTCNPDLGGTPKCALGTLSRKKSSQRLVKNVQILGISAQDIEEGSRSPHDPAQFDIVAISANPDWEEDVTGKPFAGDAGSKLVSILKAARIPLNKVYVTYLAKCKPPQGRKPTAGEFDTCRDSHLRDELELIKPKFVVLMGAETLRSFKLGAMGGLNAVHGKVYNKKMAGWEDDGDPTWKVMPTFSPLQFTYRPSAAQEARCVEDWKLIARRGQGVKGAHVAEYEVADTLDKVREMVGQLSASTWFSFDTESTSLGIRRSPMLCATFSLGMGKNWVLPIRTHVDGVQPHVLYDGRVYTNKLMDGYYCVDYWTQEEWPQVVELVRGPMEDRNISKAAHHAKYDLQVFKWWMNINIRGFIFDTMLMKHNLDEIPPNDLESLADFEFGVGDYSSSKRAITGTGDKLLATYDRVPNEILWPYGATDAECCYRLCEAYYSRLQAKPHLWQLYCEESEPSIWALFRGEWHGNPIDLTVVDEMTTEYLQKQADLEALFAANLPVNLVDNKVKPFNPMSTPDVQGMLIKLGYHGRIEDTYAANGYNTGKEILLDMASKDGVKEADWVLKYRTNRKILSTYLERAREDLDFDGRIRYSWFQSTTSGRLSCRFLHQIPRADDERIAAGLHVLRDMFITRPGYSYLYMDYSQIELRVLAILAQDKVMMGMFERNEDIHKATAACLLECKPEEVVKFNRSLGKAVNFGIVYGSKGHQLVKKGEWLDKRGIKQKVTWDMLNRGMENFKKLYPDLDAYFKDTPMVARVQGGTLRTPFGRERRMGGQLNVGNDGKREAAEREAVNFTIQSTASAITLRTAILVDRMLQGFIESGQLAEDDIVMVNTVHDSLAYEVKDELLGWFQPALKQLAERAVPQLQGKSFPCDMGVGRRWSEAEANAH